jgi:hypothetical protein
MRKLLWAFFVLISIKSFALEIQCKTDFDSVDAIIKTSPDSGITYLLLMSGESVTPIPLTSGNVQTSPQSVNYTDSQLALNIDRVLLNGEVVFDDGTIVQLQECAEF